MNGRRKKYEEAAAAALANASTQLVITKQGKAELVKAKTAEHAAQLEKFRSRYQAATSNSRVVKVDLGAGSLALVSTELINVLVRKIGEWSGEDSWFNRNSDYNQAVPHMIIGGLVYLGGMLKRDENRPPDLTVEMVREFGKLFALLGLSNLARAVRVRWEEKKEANKEAGAAVIKNQALEAENAALKAKLQNLKSGN